MLLRGVFILLVFCYLTLFQIQEKYTNNAPVSLSMAASAPFQEIVLGYLKEIGAEMLYVQLAVFLGGSSFSTEPTVYKDALAQNFDVITSLYPNFIDAYYLCESSLSYISHDSASRANEILLKGVRAHPENIIIPFFRGFNYFYYLEQPKAAAAVFFDLAKRPDAPSWFGHLAGILSARGGDLYGGLMTLRAMLATEESVAMKKRYQDSIRAFESAIRVHEAVEVFFTKNGKYPLMLEELVPQFIDQLPEVEDDFTLKWESPNLRLLRPIKTAAKD